jgi:hypothetical protein
MYQKPKPIRAIRATPPRTPPTIAPTFVSFELLLLDPSFAGSFVGPLFEADVELSSPEASVLDGPLLDDRVLDARVLVDSVVVGSLESIEVV